MITLTDVLKDVAAEWKRSNEKHGDPDLPGVFQTMLNPRGMANEYGIPTAGMAKEMCEQDRAEGRLTHAMILIEELAEAVEAAALGDRDALYSELIQVAAMAVKWARWVKP